MPIDPHDWLKGHLGPLMDAGKKLEAFDATLPSRGPTYDRGYWTGLKLVALKYYVNPYLNILASKFRVGYVDLFAGPLAWTKSASATYRFRDRLSSP